MKATKATPVREKLDELVAELNLEEQLVVVELLRVLIGNRQGKQSSLMDLVMGPLAEGSTLWEMGIDAQDWVDELRGKR